ncbi:MAG: helix-turn-helix domain-containing protein, partial [Gammaproteobacteria bacterium]
METDAPITLTDEQRTELLRRTRLRSARAEDVRRARVILMLSAGESYTAIQQAVGSFPSYISRWKARFVLTGVAGLGSRYRGQPPRILTPQLEARIL